MKARSLPIYPMWPELFEEGVAAAAADHELSDAVEIRDLNKLGVPRVQAIALHTCAHARAIRSLLGQIEPGANRDAALAIVRALVDPRTPENCEG